MTYWINSVCLIRSVKEVLFVAYAQLDRNSALGAAAEKRRRKEEADNTAIIDRDSAMGQYLVSTAEDTVNSITKSIQDNVSVYDSLQKRFSNFADENKRYVPAEQAQEFSENFATQRKLLEKQKKQLSRLGLGDSSLYDIIASQSSWFENNRLWLNNRLKYSSQFKDAKDENKSYYGWLNDDAITNSETAAERAKIYDENNARIAEIEEEMKTVGRQWNSTSGVPVYTGWGDKAKYKELKAEKEQLEAENRQYDSTQGKTDSNYKLTQNADFKQNSYAGENKNPSHEDVLNWYNKYTTSGGAWGISTDILDTEPVVDDELALYLDSTKDMEWNEATSNEYDKYYTNYVKGQQNRWDLLTDEERSIYYYLRNTKGKEAGDEFLESMASVLGKRATDEIAGNTHDMSGGELFLNNLVSVPATVLGNIGAFADTVSQLITGKEYNPYSFGNRIQSYSGIVRGETANRLDDATNNFSLLGQSAGDVYQALMSGVDSAAGVAVLGGSLHLAQAGMGALTSTARDLYERGASGAEILGVSTAAGFFEMFFEKFSVDKFTDVILGKPTKTVADIIKKALIQGGTEASEEFCTELANMATEALILGDRQRVNDDISKYMQQGDSESAATAKAWAMNLYNAAMGGFISGGAMGGVPATGQYAYHKMSEVPSMGKAIIENGGVEKLADTAYRYSGNAQLRDENNRVDGEKVGRSNRILADAATEALKNRNARTVGTLADMVTAVEEKAEKARVKQSAADLVKDAGLKGVNAVAVKRALTSENNGRISRHINNSDVFEKAAAAREARQQAEEAKRKAEIESAKSSVEERAKAAEKAIRSGDTAELVKNDAAGVRSDGMEITLGAITSAENGQISVEFDPDTHQSAVFSSSGESTPTVNTDNGATQAQVQTVKANNPEVNTLYSSLNSAVSGTIAADTHTDTTGRSFSTGTKMSVDAANVVLGLYNEKLNPSAEEYVRFMYESYKAGKSGLSFERLKDSLANKNYGFYEYEGGVTETQLRQAYISGVKEMKTIKGVTRIGVKNITDGKHKNALTQLSALDQYARKHGFSIVCVDALYDEAGTPINGEYRSGNNIVISLDADGGLYMPVVGHELFHYIENINAEDARILTDMVINTLKGVKGAEWLEARRREYEGYGYKGEEIDSEIAADFFGAAVTQKEFERQVKSAELNKSFTQKIIDKVKEIVAELKEIMQRLRGQRLIYDAALDTDAETLDFFMYNFERILDQAGTETKSTAENSGVKRQNSIENKAAYGTAQTKLTKEYRAAVDRVLNMQDTTADNLVIGYTPELMKDMGMPALPFVIGTGHVYSAAKTEAEAKKDGNYRKGVHYHGLGDTVVKNIYEQLQDPVMIIAAKDANGNASPLRSTHSVVAIVDIGTANNSLLLPVEITAERTVDGQQMDVNVLSSVYEKKVSGLVSEAIALENSGDVGIYYAKKEANALIPAGVQFPVRIQKAIASNPIVRSFDEKVNRKISDVTQSLQFKRWFGNWQNHPESIAPELLNADGTPKVFYHGAKKNGGFTIFKDWQYFTDNRKYAERYTERGNDKSLYEVYIKANKIFDTRNADARKIHEQIRQEYGLSALTENGLPDWTDGYDISDYLDEHPELGYDAIILNEGGDLVDGKPVSRGESIVVKSSNQVKSATDNIGTFDGSNPDIRYQRKLPDIRSKLDSMSRNQTVADAVEDAKTLVEDVLEYARSEIDKAKLNITETGGVLPQRSKIEKIVKKFNRNGEFSEIKNAELTDDIMAIMTDYMNGVGSSDTLLNLLSDTLYNAKLNTYDVLGTETFDDVKEFTSGGRFYVSDEVASQLKDNGYDIRKANAILSHAYGFTISGEKTGIAHKRTPWAPTGAEIASNAAYLYDGTDYSENAREGAEYETIMALIDIAENHPPVYHYYWQHELNGAKTYEERFVVQDRLADEVNEEALDLFGEIMAASPLVTKADRYRKMIDRFAEKNAAQKAKYEADLAKERARIEQIRAENREKMKELRDQKNSKMQDSVNEVRQVYRERMKQQRTDMENTAARAKQRAAIARKVKNLTNLLVNESDQKHIPQGMKNIVSEFLLPFTENSSVFGTGSDDGLNAERYMRFHDMLTDIYRATEGDADDTGALNAEYRNLAGNIDGDLLRDLESMRGTMLGKRLSALTAEELSVIDKIISNISGLVKQGNKMAVQNRTTTVSELGNKAIAELKNRKQRKKRKSPVDFAIDLAVDEMATPIYFFNQKLGGPFRELYDDFRDGQDSWYIKCDEARSRIADLQKQYNYDKWSEGVYTFELSSGEKINLTTEALLSLYAIAKRERLNGMDTEHLLSGGITLAADIEETARKAALKAEKGKTDKKQTEQYIRSEAKHITVAELSEMLSKLSDEQKAYADGLVNFLSTTVGGWGNDTSMSLFNYKKFNEEYYFPITSAKNYLYTRFAVSDDTRLKHTGFTHKVIRGANNPIVISGFTETAARHINQMALYSSFAVPIENMTRVYNYEEPADIDADGHKVRGMSVKNAVTNAYGKSANAYIADFMRAVNGGIKTDSLESKLDIGTKYFKRNAVLGNLSVAIQQPSAIMRAQAVMSGRYFMGVRLLDGEGLISTDDDGKRKTAYTRAKEEMYKYSAIAGIKKLGGFDVGIGTSVTDWMTGAKQGFFDKASEKLGILAEKADEATWTNIWLAKKREVNKRIEQGKIKLEIGSQEYFSLVAKEFRDVIDFTQVYDSVLSKSQLMCSKSRFVRSVMAFMAEPTLSYNLVLNAFRSNSTISKGKSIAAFASTVILNTLLQSLVAAWRDKDDESYWERYIKSVTSSLIGTKSTGFILGSEFNVFNNLPIIKDALSLLQGYDINRSDTEILSEVFTLYDKIKKTAQNAEKLSEQESGKYTGLNRFQEQLFGNIFDAVIMLSNLSPIPLKSVAKEVKGLENAILHATRDDMKFKTTSYTAWDAFLEGIGFEQDKPLKAYRAIKNKEEEVLRRMKSSDSWETWVRKGLKEYDKGSDLDKKAINRIEEAATANYAGDYETYERLVAAIEKEGFKRNDILAAVEGLVGKMRPKEEEKEPSDKHLYTTKMLEDAIRQDDAEAVEDIKEKLKEVEKKTDENIKSAIKSIAKKYYEDGDHTAAEKILKNYAEFSTDEVREALAWFNFSELNPDSELPYMSWQSWRSKAANGQVNNGKGRITASQYEEYYNAVKGLTGEDLDGDGKTDSGSKKKKVLAAIDKLPLTSDQKDTLFYLNGYGKSTIGEAPWH